MGGLISLGLILAITDLAWKNWKGYLILAVATPLFMVAHGFFDELKERHKKYYDQTSLEIYYETR